MPLIQHLLHVKLRHWDESLRALTARALAALTPTAPVYLAGEVLDTLLPLTVDQVGVPKAYRYRTQRAKTVASSAKGVHAVPRKDTQLLHSS